MAQPDGSISNAAAALWGKTGPDRRWHPLAAHLVDTVSVAQELWPRWVSPRTCSWLAEPLGGDLALAGSFFAWLAGCHDIGKASPAFQIQVPWMHESLQTAGLGLPDQLAHRGDAPHALVTAATIVPILERQAHWSHTAAMSVAAVLGGHHGWFPPAGFTKEPVKHPKLYGTDAPAWDLAREELMSLVARTSGAAPHLKDWRNLDLGRARELTLAGLVVLADWIASNEQLFPYLNGPFGTDYPLQAVSNAVAALPAIGWQRWEPAISANSPERFATRFNFTPNDIQHASVAAAVALDRPGLVLIEAPMGTGKTEAALAAAEVLAARFGCGGIFVGLPTQATSNQMFGRVESWLQHMDPGRYVLELAHGKARQVSDYQAIRRTGAPSCVDCDASTEAVVQAEEWFGGSKKRLLAPFVVGTVDQALIAAAKVRHVGLRQAGLTGKVTIIDEVHAYDAHMSVFLRRSLNWLGAARAPVILLSATLPPETRGRLLAAYTDAGLREPNEIGYPSVTTVTPDGAISSTTIAPCGPSKVARWDRLVEPADDAASASLVDGVVGLMREGGCGLVIRNTVLRAQASYLALRDRFGANNVTLLHARFMDGDRLERERWLTSHFGRSGERPQCHIVVGTQVLEQSLDLDLDFLVSDLAPVDLLLQRAGRVHRHAGRLRSPGLSLPHVFVGGWDEGHTSGAPLLPRGSVAVYGEHLLIRTAAVVRDLAEVRLPDDIPALVSRVYGTEDIVPPAWREQAEAAKANWQDAERDREARAAGYAIPEPARLPSLLELALLNLGDVGDDDDPVVQGAVRDMDPSVEVVLGRAIQEDQFETLGGVVVPLRKEPGPEQTDALLSSTVRLPAILTAEALAIATPPGWAQHPWLRQARPLFLDEAGRTEIGGRSVCYSPELGLEVATLGRP
ncbi:MAG: CRISPR-associated helicase Cas3' [Acidimicrobiales bacterium]